MKFSTQQIFEILCERSLATLAPDFRRLFLESGRIEAFDAGEVVCAKGETLSRLVIPLSDPLQLLAETPVADEAVTARPRVVGYLQRYRSLALRSLITDTPVPYAAVAESATTAFTLPAELMLAFLEERPRLRRYLLLVTASAGARALKEALLEAGVENDAVIDALAATWLDEVELAPGEAVDLSAPALWFVDGGAVRVTALDPTKPFDLTLPEGSWLGGEAAVAPYTYSYRATALAGTRLRRLDLRGQAAALTPEIIELVHAETCLVDARRAPAPPPPLGPRSELPGEPLGEAQVAALELPVALQRLHPARDDASSVAASLLNVMALLEIEVNAAALKADLALMPKATPLAVAAALERFGTIVTQIESGYDALAGQILPGLVTLGPRLAVLVRWSHRAVVVLDPCRGLVAVGREEFQAHWNGRFIEVTRSEVELLPRRDRGAAVRPEDAADAGRRNAPLDVMRTLFTTLKELRSFTWNRLAFMLIGLALGGLAPMLSQEVVDKALAMRDLGTVAVLSAGTLLLTAFSALMSYFGAINSNEFSIRFDHRSQTLFYRQALSASKILASRERIGEVTARFGELRKAQGFLAGTALALLSALCSIVMYSVLLASYDIRIALAAFSVFPIVLGLRLLTRDRMRANYERSFEHSKHLSSITAEQINAIGAIKAAAAERIMQERWEGSLVRGVTMGRAIGLEGATLGTVLSLLTSLVQVGCLVLVLKLVERDGVSVGTVFAVNMYVSALIAPISGLASMFSDLEQIRTAYRKVAEVIAADKDESADDALVRQTVRLSGKIKLDRVNFRYEDDGPWVLRDVSLTIYPKQVVALVGKSGCGKSTLARVLAGYLRPTTGRLQFDDFSSDVLAPSCLRQQVGFVLQDNELFSGTILENIAYGDDAPDAQTAAAAARNAGAAAFIDRLPQRYGYHLAEGGLGLSGGQKQRIAIARTLYRGPTVLIFDEATSALDAESEAAITDNMRSILGGRTAVVIAHRLSTIKNADRIVVMQDGEIVEDGSHAQLVERQGHYYELFRDQLLGGAA